MVNDFVSRHRSLSLVGFLGLLVLLAAIPCARIGLLGRTRSSPYPTPAFPIEDLLLDESVFPDGWKAHEPFDPERRIAAEQILLHFHTNACPAYMVGAGHEIDRFFAGPDSAAEAYPGEIDFWFPPNWGNWTSPGEFSYQSPVADDFRLACYTEQTRHYRHCVALGRYQGYVVGFDVRLDPEHPECMNFSDLERILIAIDERMASYLGKEME